MKDQICHHASLYYSCSLTYAQAVHNFAEGGRMCVKQYGAHACNHAMELAQHAMRIAKHGILTWKQVAK
jgi:hypothetical protein